MKRDDSVYFRHILDAIAKVDTYLQDVTEVAFLQNSLVQDGVIRQIEIIGEAARHLSQEMRETHTDVPFIAMEIAYGTLAGNCDVVRTVSKRG